MLVPLSQVSFPAVQSVQDCADYALTVAPYLQELYTFPQKLFAHLLNIDELRNVYATTNPAISGLSIALLISPIFIIAGEINQNYSQVDRFWSILPTLYHVHYALWARATGVPSAKVDNVLIFSAFWSARLTYNYWRKDGYKVGVEDYRWEVLRKKINPALFTLFNVVFIGFIQNVLLWSITTPTYILLVSSQLAPMASVGVDVVMIRLLYVILGVEFVADQQQWDYHQAKAEYKKTGQVMRGYKREDLERGFLSQGLWAWSRHPNFLAEQSVWFALYAWGAYTSQTYLNWTITGALSYHILFQSSTWFTEVISTGKYPDYKLYQRHVGRFLPKPASVVAGDFFAKPDVVVQAEKSLQEESQK